MLLLIAQRGSLLESVTMKGGIGNVGVPVAMVGLPVAVGKVGISMEINLVGVSLASSLGHLESVDSVLLGY